MEIPGGYNVDRIVGIYLLRQDEYCRLLDGAMDDNKKYIDVFVKSSIVTFICPILLLVLLLVLVRLLALTGGIDGPEIEKLNQQLN